MMKKIKCLALMVLSALILPAYAEDDVKKIEIQKVDLSFEQAFDLMLENNNRLKAIEEEVNQKKYEKRAAIGKYFPKVGVNGTYAHFGEEIQVVSNVPVIGPLATQLQQENMWVAAGGVTWNIFTGGKIIANHKAAIAKLEGTNEKYRQVKDELTVELVRRYFGLRLARDVVQVRKDIYNGIKKHLDDAKLLEAEGIIPKSERLHADVAFAQAERELDASIRDANIVEEGLKTLIKEQNVDLKDIEVNPGSLMFLYRGEFLPLNEYKELALKNNPQLKQMEVKKRLMKEKYHAELANYSPTVSLFAYDVLTQSQLSEQVPRWAVGGTVNFMLFDGLSRYNNVRAASVGRKIAEYETMDAENNIESLVVKQYQEVLKYREQYESSTKSIENAKEALRTAKLGFSEGFRTSLEVTDAELALLAVKVERLNSLYNYDVTLCDLLKSIGSTQEIVNYMNNSTKEKIYE